MSHLLARTSLCAALFLVFASGCQDLPERADPNQPPETRVVPADPVRTAAGYEVLIALSGEDVDGVVDHWEIAREAPDEWTSVEGPEWRFAYADDGQTHRVWVRAVDDAGAPDKTPTFVSADGAHLLPRTEITFGPADLGYWGTNVVFRWANDPDFVPPSGYRYALASLDDYVRDTEDTNPTYSQIIAWLDTITYFPDFFGGYFTDSLVWHFTEADSADFHDVSTTVPPNYALFGVRGLSHGGMEEGERNTNTRIFTVTNALDGPRISMTSNIAGTWDSNHTPNLREVFRGEGFHFEWHGVPGISGSPVAGYSYAVDDTTNWSPYAPTTEWPPGKGLWFPDPGPHAFFVKAIDQAGFDKVLPAPLVVYAGPRYCPAPYILVVLDTDTAALAADSIWPQQPVFMPLEHALVEYWFGGHDYQVHDTNRGVDKPGMPLLDCASSVFWFVSTDNRAGRSVLEQYHDVPANPLPSYVASGGDLFICGLSPVNATRYVENTCAGEVLFVDTEPVSFWGTLVDTCLVDHWMATQFGIEHIDRSIGNTNADTNRASRLRLCKSQVASGPNQYPDLPFDPLTWPNGPVYRGFGYYDRGIIPLDLGAGSAEVIYTANDSNDAIGIRRLTQPGMNGNLVYLGFHPYFVERPAFRDFVRAVLRDFGETATPP